MSPRCFSRFQSCLSPPSMVGLAWTHSCGHIPVLCGRTQAHPLVTTKHSCSCFGLGHTRAHLGNLGLFQARLCYGQASPIMDLRLKHCCSLPFLYLTLESQVVSETLGIWLNKLYSNSYRGILPKNVTSKVLSGLKIYIYCEPSCTTTLLKLVLI